jgi:hypothetical protein
MDLVIRSLATREGWLTQAPSLALALGIAELFYKFHSFTLECGAFLVTWWALSWIVRRAFFSRAEAPEEN